MWSLNPTPVIYFNWVRGHTVVAEKIADTLDKEGLQNEDFPSCFIPFQTPSLKAQMKHNFNLKMATRMLQSRCGLQHVHFSSIVLKIIIDKQQISNFIPHK